MHRTIFTTPVLKRFFYFVSVFYLRYWKTGFYYIAQGANVPIVLSYLDYKRKIGGIGPIIMPTGDIEADMEIIRTFYASVTGKHAIDAGEARIS